MPKRRETETASTSAPFTPSRFVAVRFEGELPRRCSPAKGFTVRKGRSEQFIVSVIALDDVYHMSRSTAVARLLLGLAPPPPSESTTWCWRTKLDRPSWWRHCCCSSSSVARSPNSPPVPWTAAAAAAAAASGPLAPALAFSVASQPPALPLDCAQVECKT